MIIIIVRVMIIVAIMIPKYSDNDTNTITNKNDDNSYHS